jgi:hypothetical protein
MTTETDYVNRCVLCKSANYRVIVDAGPQPVCNRFLHDRDAAEFRHPLCLGQCLKCGLVQLADPLPPEQLKPKFDWIRYSEPEDHLDHAAAILGRLRGSSPPGLAVGLSSKDETLLQRLQASGMTTTQIDIAENRSGEKSGVGPACRPDRAYSSPTQRQTVYSGEADLVVARHILEHWQDLNDFAWRLHNLLRPYGYALIEVPACDRQMISGDYSMMWEEHKVYFTPTTLQNYLVQTGFSLIYYKRIAYRLEDSLVAVVKKASPRASFDSLPKSLREEELKRASGYAEMFDLLRCKLHRFLGGLKCTGATIAVFGAGHMACTFTNILEIEPYVDYFIDGDPHKIGLYMPGNRRPVHSAKVLEAFNPDFVLLGINPDRELAVMQQSREYLRKGGKFLSIFPGSGHSLSVFRELRTPDGLLCY